MIRDITNYVSKFPLSTSDFTVEDEVCAGGGHGTPFPIAFEASWRITGVSQLLTGDWSILSRDFRLGLGPILTNTFVPSTEATTDRLQIMDKS